MRVARSELEERTMVMITTLGVILEFESSARWVCAVE